MTLPGESNVAEQAPPPTVLERMGGVPGLVYGAVPSVVYVVGDAVAGLNVAVVVAVGAGAAITALRLWRRESVAPALSGLLGVLVAAYIAYQSESARDYFLLGIWSSLVLGVVFLASVVIRRPLVGVVWNALKGRDDTWRTDKVTLYTYDIATLVFVAVLAARFVVQRWLYDENATGWLAFTKIAMGYPLLAVALLVTAWAIRRADRRAKALSVEAHSGAPVPGP